LSAKKGISQRLTQFQHSAIVDPIDHALVYEEDDLATSGFTEVEIISKIFHDLLDQIPAIGEKHRIKIMNRINWLQKRNQKRGFYYNLLHKEPLKARMNKKLFLKPFEYDCCEKGCRAYFLDGDEDDNRCPCGIERTKEDNHTTKMYSLSDLLAIQCVKPSYRELLKHRSQHVHKRGQYDDFYDGLLYRNMVKDPSIIENSNTIVLGFFY
jgi:hypothetical protein